MLPILTHRHHMKWRERREEEREREGERERERERERLYEIKVYFIHEKHSYNDILSFKRRILNKKLSMCFGKHTSLTLLKLFCSFHDISLSGYFSLQFLPMLFPDFLQVLYE